MSWWRPLEDSLPENPDDVTPGFEVTPEQRDAIIEAFARRVVARDMEMPAILLLETTKPVSFLLSQALLLGGPVLYPFLGMERVERFAGFLNSRANIEKLIRRIEEMSEAEGCNSTAQLSNQKGESRAAGEAGKEV